MASGPVVSPRLLTGNKLECYLFVAVGFIRDSGVVFLEQIDEKSEERFVLKRSVFRTLLLSMLAFGVAIGLVFPFFTKAALGYDKALSVGFALMCVAAGIAVGGFNFFLFKVLVSRELGKIAEGMQSINEEMKRALYEEENQKSIKQLQVDSADKIGELVNVFNSMSQAIDERINLEKTLREFMATLSSSVELNKVSLAITEAIIQISGTEGGAVLYGSLDNELELLNVSGMDKTDFLPSKIEPGIGVASGIFFGDRIQILVADGKGKEWAAIFTQTAIFYPPLVILIPLVAESRTVGLMVLAYHRSYLTPRRRKMLELFRTYVSPYLQNALLHKRIQEIASEDGLTGCLNRRFGMRRLHEEFSLAVRNNGDISVVLLDIDHFKTINDTYGHAAGDFVLKRVASLLQENVRTGEVVCRYGGEEFLIVAPGGSLDKTGHLAERLRKLVEGKVFSYEKDSLRVTISFGVASWPDSGDVSSAEELVNEADDALYFAKESGRNMTAVKRGGQAVLFKSE